MTRFQALALLSAVSFAACEPVGNVGRLGGDAFEDSDSGVPGIPMRLPDGGVVIVPGTDAGTGPAEGGVPMRAELARYRALAAGSGHACGITAEGAVECWGSNAEGKLGNGRGEASSLPVAVQQLSGPVKQLALGDAHSCALLESGAVMCWGSNAQGQVGDGTQTARTTAVAVSGLNTPLIQLSAQTTTTCGRSAAGELFCWGAGTRVPTRDESAQDVASVSVGGNFTCVLSSQGAVSCKGSNQSGQLGDDDRTVRSNFVPIVPLSSGVLEISTGSAHACARKADGVWCWGQGNYGQLGNEKSVSSSTPVQVSGLTGAAALATSRTSSCVLSAEGQVSCWGELFWPTPEYARPTPPTKPVPVAGLRPGVQQLAMSGTFACALLADQSVQCWGANPGGQLGNGSLLTANPRWVGPTALRAKQLSSGDSHTCVVTEDDTALCWGNNSSGQLGTGAVGRRAQDLSPMPVRGLPGKVQRIAVGKDHSCALTDEGRVFCWGDNEFGQLGSSSADTGTPLEVKGLGSGNVSLAVGNHHACVVTLAGGVLCWGAGSAYQLGNGLSTKAVDPVAVTGLSSGAVKVAAGDEHTCAVLADGGLRCWGANRYGQVGNGTTSISVNTPVVAGIDHRGNALGGITDVRASYANTFVRSGDRWLWWGAYFAQSESHINYTGAHTSPLGTSSPAATSADYRCSAASYSAPDRINCATSYTSNRTLPGSFGRVRDLVVGSAHGCALTEEGRVLCWGSNSSGQLGIGAPYATVPLDVVRN